MTDTAAVAEPTPASPLIRIQAISLTNFRAFPGPSAARFELHGKNLLVYGENGAGKSSLFHALAGFFSSKPAGTLADHKNVFYSQPDAECKVSVEYLGDAKPVDWTTTQHPCVVDEDFPVTDMYEWYFANSDFRTIDAARRCAFLDYKALLNTNFSHGADEVNLFEIAVEHLLRDYPATTQYSFNNADEHFNDILRVHPDRRIDVIAPEATTDYFLHRMEKVFGTAASQYSHCKVQGLDCRQARKVRLIAARADQVDIAKLFGDA